MLLTVALLIAPLFLICPAANGYSLLPTKSRQIPKALYNSNVGKGDDTIKELNRFTSIVIDPSLVSDSAFWDYCILPNQQAPMRLHVLGGEGGNNIKKKKNANDVLVDCGADREDVEFYEESYGVFEGKVTLGAPTSVTGLVVTKRTFDTMDAIDAFAKIILVRGDDYDDYEDDGITNDDGNDDTLRRIADIDVSSLGELRALTICSYAYLTKKS